jgi:hypothetical protein
VPIAPRRVTVGRGCGTVGAMSAGTPSEAGAIGPGTELDGFVIESVAGRGGMGVVYRARQRPTASSR